MQHLLLKISIASYVVLWAVTTASAAVQPERSAKVVPEFVQTKGVPEAVKLTLDAQPVQEKS